MTNPLTIREGDIGRMRNGELTGPLRRCCGGWYNGTRFWHSDGLHLYCMRELEIVAIVDPPAAEARSEVKYAPGDLITIEVCAVLKDGRPCVATEDHDCFQGVIGLRSIKGHIPAPPKPIAVGDRVEVTGAGALNFDPQLKGVTHTVIAIDGDEAWLKDDGDVRHGLFVKHLTRLPDDGGGR